ncbi:rhodanese-like domain-containing protein [Rathayibacter sp. YIM 133350]|uniref:sulfurtransferase n=1 Tax=Rathayibacter sp. YIM 133350 TaxID=3131992 RepID=UPI00307ECC9D
MSAPAFIDAAGLAALLAAEPPPVVLDATLVLHKPRFDGDFRAESGRGRWLAGHIPGSRHVAIDTEFSAPHATHDHHEQPQGIADRLAALGIGRHTRAVVYDTVGTLWAARLWYLLDWIGVDVSVLDGGLRAWEEEGLPVVAGADAAPSPVPAEPWVAGTVRTAWVDREEIEHASRALPGRLVCGLSATAFAGTEPTRYARRGHIPESVNVPARSLFDAGGRVLPPATVRARHVDAGADLGSELLLYCGGGISATANALALAHAGIRSVRVYDGSLEEWSADPALPLVTGG